MKPITTRSAWSCALIILLLAQLVGCSAAGGTSLAVGPSWYVSYEDEDEGKIYGYGMSAGERNPALAEASAKAAAREDIAATVNTLIQAMLERYLTSTTNGEAMRENLHTVNTLRSLTNQSVTGFRVNKQEAKGDFLYVRGYLALDDLKKSLRNSEAVQAALNKVREDAKAAFDRMDDILDEEAPRANKKRNEQ